MSCVDPRLRYWTSERCYQPMPRGWYQTDRAWLGTVAQVWFAKWLDRPEVELTINMSIIAAVNGKLPNTQTPFSVQLVPGPAMRLILQKVSAYALGTVCAVLTPRMMLQLITMMADSHRGSEVQIRLVAPYASPLPCPILA
eukprot:2323171-Rhodomonas_salina.2